MALEVSLSAPWCVAEEPPQVAQNLMILRITFKLLSPHSFDICVHRVGGTASIRQSTISGSVAEAAIHISYVSDTGHRRRHNG